MYLWSRIRSSRAKNKPVLYYARNALRLATPRAFCRWRLPARLATMTRFDEADVRRRVDYYNKLEPGRAEAGDLPSLADFKWPGHGSAYYLDAYEYVRCFPFTLRAAFLFGDVTWIPDRPSLTKSRPIAGDNANSVLLKLDKRRHFMFVKDARPWAEKRDMLVGRSVAAWAHRRRFLERWFGHPRCDIGQTNQDENSARWGVGTLTVPEHLAFKFILALEGNDVATNLKWVMSSNSLAVMPRPTYETWFMEGTLIPDHHYVCIKDDYSDLEERLGHFIAHPDQAQRIIDNAHRHVAQFRDGPREDLISLLVLQKYFERTGQAIG
jgi:hypothetical protein